MLIENGNVFIDGEFKRANVEIVGGFFGAVEELCEGADASARTGDDGCVFQPLDDVRERNAAGADASAIDRIDATGCYVIPGMIDLHFHGAMGFDMCDASEEAISELAKFEAAHGVTAICPATMTYPERILAPIMDAAKAFVPERDEAALVGVNMEGPFISPRKVGAQNPEYVQPCDADMVRRLQERAGGLLKLVDIAPEEPGAIEFVKEMASEVRISIAHTCAGYDDAKAAFDAGACHVTHLFNAMPGLHHREPGPIAAAFDGENVMVEIIGDGKHIDPAMIRVAFQMFGDERVVLISDSMRAAGLEDGEYDLGGQVVSVHDDLAWLTPDTIAGSVTDVGTCVRRCAGEFGLPLESVVRAATENPARALGVFDERGSIASGKIADAVLLDEDLSVKAVIVRGELL